MILKVGNYTLNGDFKSKSEAKKVFLQNFPSVTEKDLEHELSKHFKNADKSESAKSEDTKSKTKRT